MQQVEHLVVKSYFNVRENHSCFFFQKVKSLPVDLYLLLRKVRRFHKIDPTSTESVPAVVELFGCENMIELTVL